VNGRCRIAAVGVVVPARDEQERIGACLRSIRAAIDKVPHGIRTAVTVVLDRCTDETPALVDQLLRHWPAAAAVKVVPHVVAGAGVGAVRDLGVRLTLERLRPQPLDATWLLHTDADTTVPPDWALAHLRHARAGACGVAGLADLGWGDPLSIAAQQQYHALIRNGLDGDRHLHVYGANLGVRADAYVSVGGFPPDGPGEDHGLWRRLDEAGYRLTCPTTVRVRTSARLRGRAAGGLADLLRSLDSDRGVRESAASRRRNCR
jgi:Glycosyltransferase like family 2